MDINQLREEYGKLSGKRAFPGWKEEQLQAKINELQAGTINEEEQARIEEAKRINSMSHQTIDPFDIPPVFIDGKPYGLIDNKHVPWADFQILAREDKIKKLNQEIEDIKSGKIIF